MKSSTCARRLGAQHFAHLRAVTEGVPVIDAARRYLGIDHGHQALAAHRVLVAQLQALARRRGDPAWRLIGLMIGLGEPAVQRPTLEAFMADRDLDGWSEAEVLELYRDSWPEDRRAARRQRLRSRQLALLQALQSAAAEQAQVSDAVDGWFDPLTAERLRRGGVLLLGDLVQRIRLGGRWWAGLPAIGAGKAGRIAAVIEQLLPGAGGASRPTFALPAPARDNGLAGHRPAEGLASGSRLTPAEAVVSWQAAASDPLQAALAGRSDADLIQAWVAARSGAASTANSYRREALRFLLWLNQERGKGFRTADVEDCLAYMTFLAHLPPAWLSRRHSTVMGRGWAPFRGPLSLASRQQAVIVLGSFFGWLVDLGCLPLRNPWLLVNRRVGDDAARHQLDSRAFTPAAWQALLDHLQRQPPSPARDRIEFLLGFVEATGLRASELLDAQLGAFRWHKGRLAMQVHGKGARNRVIAVPGQAVAALELYLQRRGLPGLDQSPATTPLVASTLDGSRSIGYQALYQTLTRWVRRALQGSSLPEPERRDALRASPHWLRHTFGTRALERKAPIEVVQRQLGHADPRTTMRYAKAQLEHLQAEMATIFAG